MSGPVCKLIRPAKAQLLRYVSEVDVLLSSPIQSEMLEEDKMNTEDLIERMNYNLSDLIERMNNNLSILE